MKRIFSTGGGVIAILLASMILFGCEAPSSGDTEAWIINETDQKVWEKANNDGEKTLRAFEGFGSLNTSNGAVVKIEIGNSRNSKAGILFDYKDYNAEGTTVQYYQVGVGTSGYNGTTPEYYITKVTDMAPADITASTTSDDATGGKGQSTDLVQNTPLSPEYATFDGNKMTIYVGFIQEGEDVVVKVGKYDENSSDDVKWVSNAYETYTITDLDVSGNLCAYAMLKKASGSEVSTVNKYTRINKTGKAADAE